METGMKGFMEENWWFKYGKNLRFKLKFLINPKGREDPVDFYK
jgi:hypothetical protein